MKTSSKYLFLIIISVITLLISTCKVDELARVTKILTGTVSQITSTSATVSATFVDLSGNVTEYGHCWNTTGSPLVSDGKYAVNGTAQKGDYSSGLTGLIGNTMYYVRAYAIEGETVVYGNEISFNTTAYNPPTISTNAITVFDYQSATGGGNISSDGGQTVTARGVCWSTSENPTIADSKTNDGSGTGEFTSSITGLSASTTYYVRAYATTSVETIYGNQQSFTTSEAPSIVVTSPTNTDHWAGGESYYITWNDNIDENVTIQLLDGSTPVLDIVSGSGTPSNGSYNWSIPNTVNDGTNYKIKITSVSNSELSGLSNAFEIAKPPKDFDNNVYKIVRIGEQWWMKENLRSIHYSNGDAIPNVTLDANWVLLTNTSQAYSYYNNNTSLADPYGALYTWAAAMKGLTTESAQGVCPAGWHVPSDTEWKTLEKYLGMSETDADLTGWRGNEGNALKETGTDHWNSTNGGTNGSGFTAVGAGYRSSSDGVFYSLTDYTQFWTSTLDGSNDAWYRELRYDENRIRHEHYLRNYGRSVRCVKD